MERVIKFRVWDSKEKKWLLGYEYPNLGGFSMKGEIMLFGQYQKMLSSFRLEDWDDIIIMQFTGLKDRNGKETYEGDLAMIDGNICEVKFGVFFTCGWEFNIVNKLGRYPFHSLCNTFNDTGCKDFDIIGNIYENPDLIKK